MYPDDKYQLTIQSHAYIGLAQLHTPHRRFFDATLLLMVYRRCADRSSWQNNTSVHATPINDATSSQTSGGRTKMFSLSTKTTDLVTHVVSETAREYLAAVLVMYSVYTEYVRHPCPPHNSVDVPCSSRVQLAGRLRADDRRGLNERVWGCLRCGRDHPQFYCCANSINPCKLKNK